MKATRQSQFKGARRLWTGRFQGVLSTQSAARPGYPFGSVVPYCLDTVGLPVLLLSHLAQHTRNLEADPRCAFTLAAPTEGDVQQSERLIALGDCTRVPPEDLTTAARYFRYFPNGRTYYERLNFRLYRLVPIAFHYNAGFATARWGGTERILRPSPLGAEEELALLRWIQEHCAQVAASALPATPDEPGAVEAVGVDPRGLDLRRGEHLTRLHFPNTLTSTQDIRDYLAGLG